MNANKSKSIIVEKTPEKQCEVNVKGQRLTQVKQYKYLGTTVEHTRQCKTIKNKPSEYCFLEKGYHSEKLHQHENQNRNYLVLHYYRP